jgi:DNA (cytosine-5)-methyltransferase 1
MLAERGGLLELGTALRPRPKRRRLAEILDADPLLAPAIGEIDLWSVARRNLGFPPLVGTIGRRGGMAWDLDPTAAAQVKSEVRRIADGMANRLDRLRLCGNGVFPLAVAVAWLCLELTLEQAGRSADALVRAA